MQRLFSAFGEAMPVAATHGFGGIAWRNALGSGALLVSALAPVLLVLGVAGLWPGGIGATLLMAVLAAGGMVRASATDVMQQRLARAMLALIALVLPDASLVWLAVAAMVGHRCWIMGKAQDQLAGIVAALYAPLLMGAGLLLVLLYENWDGLFALAVAGSLIGVHALHRFPPRLVCGRSGLLVLAGANIITLGALINAQAWMAIGILWSLPLAMLVHDLAQASRAHEPLFALARQRGEPASGLVAAAGSLACTHAVLVWASVAQPLPFQLGALGLGLFLAWQFTRFLSGGAQIPFTRVQARSAPEGLGRAATETP